MRKFNCWLVLALAGWVGSVSAIPITGADIVTVDGTNWAQVDLFTNLSWDDINAVCPSGNCIDGGLLNGYTMTDWFWASVDEVNALFNIYLSAGGVTGTDLLGPGGDFLNQVNSSWAPSVLIDFRYTESNPGLFNQLSGLSSTLQEPGIAWAPHIRDFTNSSASDSACSLCGVGQGGSSTTFGGWFYKAETTVPAPATIALVGLGLAGLGWTQRKKAKK